jgi:hypothetical protein
VGVDIKVANQQRSLAFPKTPNIADQVSKLFTRSLYIHEKTSFPSPPFPEYIYYEPIHFILTTTWLVFGGLFQSSAVLKNVSKQPYIPFIWKVAIILSSFFLMGPLFIYFFSIFTILTSNASIPEKKRVLLLVGSMIKQINM